MIGRRPGASIGQCWPPPYRRLEFIAVVRERPDAGPVAREIHLRVRLKTVGSI
jgi:hypothetical protein